MLLRQQISSPQDRIVIALAGVPGSGKSTVCARVLVDLAERGIHDIAVATMVSSSARPLRGHAASKFT